MKPGFHSLFLLHNPQTVCLVSHWFVLAFLRRHVSKPQILQTCAMALTIRDYRLESKVQLVESQDCDDVHSG